MNNTKTKAISYPDNFQSVSKNAQTLGASQSEVMKAFAGLHKAGASPGALDAKTKELMALAISVVNNIDLSRLLNWSIRIDSH